MKARAADFSKNVFTDWHKDQAQEILQNVDIKKQNLIDVLRLFQNTFGYIDQELIPLLAKSFNLSRAEVHGVTSFYHDFREEKPAAFILKVCQAESCQAMGCEQLTSELKSTLGIDFNENNLQADIRLEPVYCLGNCACSPNLMVNDTLLSRMNSKNVKPLLKMLKESGND